MANEEKKNQINIEDFDKAVQSHALDDTIVEWNGLEIVVHHTIGLIDMMEFVNDVSESCFSDSGVYVPEIRDFAIKSNIISKYTNIALPDDLVHRYELIYCSNICPAILKHIDSTQIGEIMQAIDRRISYACNTNIVAIQRELSQIIDTMEKLGKGAENMFDGISPDDIQKLVGAVANGEIDEESLVKAYLDQTQPKKNTRRKASTGK